MVTHVLTQYEHHVAQMLWEGEDRGSLKVITHGLKLKKFTEIPMSDPVEHWIREFGLLHLSSAYLTMADAGLRFTFVERWHRETSSFHLSFGDMTITLDNVTNLLHISSHDRCRDYLWGTAPLVFLYDNLGDGVVHDTRQLGGYMTLLQCWIYEHFPKICKWGDRGAVPAHLPRACRWTEEHVVEGRLMTYRRRLDALLLEDVVFTPYDDDRANHLFVSISIFSGYLQCGGVLVPYLSERCLRQFGRIQCIPHDVPLMPNSIDWMW
uniref:Protein MAIN-LIKE 1-like n=1 Tax=Cicer arietinum TaxID=3827 RepID=A0A1S2YMF5_CICAR|nr:protein MAIN-LIKE 1-like [Cicer arietinum]